MTLEEAIQQRWNGDAALTTLVPIERVVTSFAPAETARAYVVVERRRSKPALWTSGGLRAAAVELVFRVVATGYDEAAAIAAPCRRSSTASISMRGKATSRRCGAARSCEKPGRTALVHAARLIGN